MNTTKSWAYHIFYEDSGYYCEDCMTKRLDEINTNKEFAEYIDFEHGNKCGYMFDTYADEDYPVECCMCGRAIQSNIDLEE